MAAIYRAAIDPENVYPMLASLSQYVRAEAACLIVESPATGQVVQAYRHGIESEAADAFFRQYRGTDPAAARFREVPPGEWLLTHSDDSEPVVSGGGRLGALMRLELGRYRGFLGLVLARASRAFPGEGLERLKRLSPHLRRASEIAVRSGRASAKQIALENLLDTLSDAVLIVTSEGRVLHANAVATDLLSEADGLEVRDGKLCASEPAIAKVLARTISLAAAATPMQLRLASREASMLIPRKADHRAYLLSVVPVAPPREALPVVGLSCAAIWIVNPNRSRQVTPEWLAAVLGITPGEAKVAHAIFGGASVAAAAKSLGIGESTAKTHLASVFNKVGVRRQSDLVRLITGLKPDFRR